jgi:Kef-type K+ transport system membrane component KefB
MIWYPTLFAAATSEPTSGDPAASSLLALAVILISAKLGGELAVRLKQPAVLGELLAGVLLGNVTLFHAQWIGTLEFISLLSHIGVVVLLFEIGLESTVSQMMSVGRSALLVAVIGVACPFVLGFGVTRLMLPAAPTATALFLGATLTATSVGITARVFKDLSRENSSEARLILGASVLDDVLGLMILTVVTQAIVSSNGGSAFSATDIVFTVLKALLFLIGALVVGRWLSPRLFALASLLHARNVLLPVSLGFCFVLAYLANTLGLAPIVGAFAAGLILEEVHYRDLAKREQHTLEGLIHPISSFLVPVFFVSMGMHVDVASFLSTEVALLALLLTLVAVAGKLVSGLGVLEKNVSRLQVGLGMIPRGEVGLIFASVGSTLTVQGQAVVGPSTFSALVAMVMATTLLTPIFLSLSIQRLKRAVDRF